MKKEYVVSKRVLDLIRNDKELLDVASAEVQLHHRFNQVSLSYGIAIFAVYCASFYDLTDSYYFISNRRRILSVFKSPYYLQIRQLPIAFQTVTVSLPPWQNAMVSGLFPQ